MSTTTASAPAMFKALRSRTRRRSLVGIEAAESYVRLAQGQAAGDGRRWRVAEVRLPDGITAGGAARQIRSGARAAGIGGAPAVCAVCTPKVDAFPLTLRAVATESLDSQVASQAIDRLNCSPAEVVIDYARLPVEMTRGGEHGVAVMVFAVPRELAEGLLRTLDHAGLEIERLITPACALAAAMARAEWTERHLVVFPSEEATSVSVVQGGHVLLERFLPWSVRGLVAHMRGELDLEEEQCRRLLSQEPEIETGGRDAGAAGSLDSLASALREILGPFFQDLAREVASCVGYSDSFLLRTKIAGIVLAGPMAGNALLREFVTKASELPLVELEGRGDLPRRGACPPDSTYLPAASCALWPQEVGS